MKISFAAHPVFSVLCEQAIAAHQQALRDGRTITVFLEPGGDSENVTVTIPALDATVFLTDWQGSDHTRFPTRLQAAATALRDSGFAGNFTLFHGNGLLCIRRVNG